MNQFSQHTKVQQTKASERIKIKSKYFGQYQPQLFIASRSKSKSRSASKDDIFTDKKFSIKPSEQNLKSCNSNNSNDTNKQHFINSINPEKAKSPKSFGSGSLSEYLLARSASPGRKKGQSAIQMIIAWVQRKYNENLLSQKIEKGTSISQFIQREDQYKTSIQKTQHSFKKMAYDVYILKRLKSGFKLSPISPIKPLRKPSETKEHAIDNLNISPVNQSSKAQDFDIYKFKASQMYATGNNLFPINQLSIQNLNRSGIKNHASNENLPERQDNAFKEKLMNQIPTMNSLQTLDLKLSNEKNNLEKRGNILNASSQNRIYFTETARSASTNEILQISKTSLFSNSFSDKQKSSQDKNLLKNLPLSDKDMKKSITIEGEFDSVSDFNLKLAKNLDIVLKKKQKNQLSLCDIDFQPNALFHPQKVADLLNPIEINTLDIVNYSSEQILNEVFQMNDCHQQILKKLSNKASYILSDEKKFLLNHSKNDQSKISKKSIAQNYFSLHLEAKNSQKPGQFRTFQMPLIKANTQMAVKAFQGHKVSSYATTNLLARKSPSSEQFFTFNSLNPQSKDNFEFAKPKISFLPQKQQPSNAFIQKCNFFGFCGTQNAKQLQRSNYFTEASTAGRQRGISCNSNQSKTSSKPKISFNYVSPSSKDIPILTKEKVDEVLFKNQNSYLKNSEVAPVKIEVENSRQNKKQEEVKKINQEKNSQNYALFAEHGQISTSPIIGEIKYQTQITNQKQRSQSVPHFFVQKPTLQQSKPQMTIQIPKIITQKKIQNRNAFVSAGYGPIYYQSQKVLPFAQNIQPQKTQPSYQSIQSYYFSNIISSHPTNTQAMNRIQPQMPFAPHKLQANTLRKQQQLGSRNDPHYLYPIQNSVQKQRTQRARSLNEKILVTVKKIKQ